MKSTTPLPDLRGYTAIPVRQSAAGQLLINARVNGVDGLYILDSGASHTVVDMKQTERLLLTLNHDEAADTGGGVGAHGLENIPSYNNKLQIGDFSMDELVVAVMSLDTAWESLARVGAHDELSGIIGVDILKAGNAVLDFSSMTLYLALKDTVS